MTLCIRKCVSALDRPEAADATDRESLSADKKES